MPDRTPGLREEIGALIRRWHADRATVCDEGCLCGLRGGLRERLAEVLREKFDWWIVAEWICCEPPAKGHDLCRDGYAARRIVASLLADDPEQHPAASPILDALMPVVGEALAEQAQTLRAVEIDRDQWRDRARHWKATAERVRALTTSSPLKQCGETLVRADDVLAALEPPRDAPHA